MNLMMRKRFINKTEQQYRIRNRFSYGRDTPTEEIIPSITTSSDRNIRSSKDDNHNMEPQYNYERDNREPQYNYERDDRESQYNYERDDRESQYNYEHDDDMESDNMESQYNYEHDDNMESDNMESQYNYEHNDMEPQYNYGYDDLEFQYNYGNDDTDFDNYEESDNRHENEEEEEERQQIVDKALNKDKMPSFSSELAPYFENLTAASLFCWLQKHNISTSAYEDLADILHNTNFNPAHVIKNVRRFRSWRERLPLLPISARLISISSKKTRQLLKIPNLHINYLLVISFIMFLTIHQL